LFKKVGTCCEVKGTNGYGIVSHLFVSLQYSSGCYFFLRLPWWKCGSFEKEIAGIKDEKRCILLSPDSFYLVCFFGQTAQLVGVSATAFDFTIHISRIEEQKPIFSMCIMWKDCAEYEK